MNGFKCKKLPGPAAVESDAVAVDGGATEPLLDLALAWVERLRQRGQTHLFYPVSRLQREFRLGYARSRALVDGLAQRGEWTVAFSGDGTRYARIRQMPIPRSE